jgi:hypothetical protein
VLQSEKYRGGGRSIQGDLRAQVDCECEVRRVDGVVEWHGRFSDADPTSEPVPGAARLFADRKSAEIIVVSVLVGTGAGRFEGDGPAPG